jgi:pyruvate dehydrogenase E2 component (dihydrolipoamide acetyltransferase)
MTTCPISIASSMLSTARWRSEGVAMSVSEFKLPDVGEGLTEAEIVSWKVKPGDTVKVNDVIVEIETAKSLVELPCPYAGVVGGLLVEEGTTVPVGTPIIAVQTGDGPATPPSAGATETSPYEDLIPQSDDATNGDSRQERQAVLVGYGPRVAPTKRRPRKPTTSSGLPTTPPAKSGPPTQTTPPATPVVSTKALAKPPVRKLAKDLHVDIALVSPTGPNGTVTRDDVRIAAGDVAPAPALSAELGWSGLSREERVPIRSVRRATAQAVTRSAFTAPHVTEFLTLDVSRTMKLVKRLSASREFRDVKLSPLALVAKALCMAIPRNPDANSRWDDEAGEIVVQRYVNLGIAAATPRGLVVPNVKDADRLSLRELAVAVNTLAATARERKTPPEDMLGGTITITNVGVFGIDSGTPILNPGEAAILAFGAVRQQPWVHKGKVKPRWVTTLALSFDHRLVDGEAGSKLLADVAAVLEDPGTAATW